MGKSTGVKELLLDVSSRGQALMQLKSNHDIPTSRQRLEIPSRHRRFSEEQEIHDEEIQQQISESSENHIEASAETASTYDCCSPLRSPLKKSSDLEVGRFTKDGKFKLSVEKVEEPKNEAEDMTDNPKKGTFFFVLQTILMSVNLYAGSATYIVSPTTTIIQLTFARAIITSLIMIVYVNKNLKHVCIDSVDRASVPSLVFRAFQSGVSVFIGFLSLKYFNVSTVGIVCSLTPVFVCFIAYFMLGERMRHSDIFSLFAVIMAAMLVICGSEGEEKATEEVSFMALVALLAQPLLLAGGAVSMRKMRKMPEDLVSCYVNFTLAIGTSLVMYMTGEDFLFFLDFSPAMWVLIVITSALSVIIQQLKYKAFRYQEASKLQKLSFLPNVWQFSVDCLVLQTAFTITQQLGFALLFMFYAVEFVDVKSLFIRQKKIDTPDEFQRV